LLALLAGAAWLIAVVIAPLHEPLLLGGATAVLSGPVLYGPCLRLVRRLVPRLGTVLHRQVAAITATVLLVAIVVSPALLLVLSVVHSLDEAVRLLIGIALQDSEALTPFMQSLEANITRLAELYPRLEIDPPRIVTVIADTISASTEIGPAVLSFLFRGSSRIAELILALISIGFFYAHGPQLIRAILDFSPLGAEQQDRLMRRQALVAEHILVTSLGTACIKGLLYGLIAWSAGLPLPVPLIVLLAGIFSLLPLVGLTMIWLPMGLLAWGQGNHVTAVWIVIASILANYGFDHLRQNYQRRRGLFTESWINFALFIGLIGGLLSFGPAGLIIGPVAMAIMIVLATDGLPLYMPRPHEHRETEAEVPDAD
ncbi:MAG: AI-2E family transporter, partial [Planctomycetota bacterium]